MFPIVVQPLFLYVVQMLLCVHVCVCVSVCVCVCLVMVTLGRESDWGGWGRLSNLESRIIHQLLLLSILLFPLLSFILCYSRATARTCVCVCVSVCVCVCVCISELPLPPPPSGAA